jgi:hypothetical protein
MCSGTVDFLVFDFLEGGSDIEVAVTGGAIGLGDRCSDCVLVGTIPLRAPGDLLLSLVFLSAFDLILKEFGKVGGGTDSSV